MKFKRGFTYSLLPFALCALALFFVHEVSAATGIETPVNTAATRGGRTRQVLVTNVAGGTIVSNAASALSGRKSIEMQNLGGEAIYCTVDGTAPTINHARAVFTQAAWSVDAGPAITIRCIALTTLQVDGAGTIVTEVR